MRENARHVRTYYSNNRAKVYLSKAIKRCRETGAIPSIAVIKRYRLGLVPFFIAFADWAGQATNYRKRHAQHKKLELLYKAYYDEQHPPYFYTRHLFTPIPNDRAPDWHSSDEYESDDEPFGAFPDDVLIFQ